MKPSLLSITRASILASILVLWTANSFAQTPVTIATMPPVITVSGNAQLEATPDQAVVRVGIVRQSGAARDAQEEANRIGQAILKAIGAVGVPAQRIQTSRLTLSPVYGQQRPGNNDAPRITGYTASNTVAVTLENLAQIGPVVDAALDNGANQLDSIQFQLKDDATVRAQALKLAVAEAMGKAQAMAEALSVGLGQVMELTESGVSVSPMQERGGQVFAMAARASTPTPVSAGQIEVSASVVLKYAIVHK